MIMFPKYSVEHRHIHSPSIRGNVKCLRERQEARKVQEEKTCRTGINTYYYLIIDLISI